jgi:S-adenosylmethionine/arginine decarboxylase-like enzyme
MTVYGYSNTLDASGCDSARFTRENIEAFFVALCDAIDMERADLHFWGYDDPEEYAAAPPHLKGTSAVQFIMTSTITLHALDDLGAVFIDLFSCKPYEIPTVKWVVGEYFGGVVRVSPGTKRTY